MANNLTPIVYDAASKEHKPANIGDHINPAYIAVDSGTGNLLQNKPDNGLRVEAADFVSPASGNMLTVGTDGKLYAGAGDMKILSGQPGNYLRYGNDGGVFLDGNDVLSNGRANLLHTSDRDGKVELLEEDLTDLKLGGPSSDRDNLLDAGTDGKALLQPKVINHMIDDKVGKLGEDLTEVKKTAEDAKKTADEALEATKHIVVDVVSRDRKNVITEGSDKGAYLSADDIVDIVEDAGITKVDVKDLINTGDPLLSTQGDKLVAGLQVQYNEANGRLDILGVHGNSIAHTTIPTAVALLEQVNLEDNPSGQPSGTYIHFQFRLTDGSLSHVYLNVNKLAQFYSAGEGIKISSDGEVSVDRPFVEGVVTDEIDDELKPGGSIKEAIDEAVGDVIVVSGNTGNLISEGTDDGALLTKDTIVNAITDDVKGIAEEAIDEQLEDGGSISTAIKEAVIEGVTVVSADAGNVLTAGSDKGSYLGKSGVTDAVNDEIAAGNVSLVSGDADNLLKPGDDGGVFLDKNDIPAAGVSTDAGNALTMGSDNKPFFQPVTDYGVLA